MRPKIIVTIIGAAFLVLSLAAIIEQRKVESTASTDQARRPERPIAPRLRIVPPTQGGLWEKVEEQQRLLESVRVSLEDLPEPPIFSNETPEELDARLQDMDRRLEKIMPTAEECENLARAVRLEEEIKGFGFNLQEFK